MTHVTPGRNLCKYLGFVLVERDLGHCGEVYPYVVLSRDRR
jgi:hypothetical protein